MLNTKFPLDPSTDPWAPHFHAIGAITVAWNTLEDTTGLILQNLTRFDAETAEQLVAMLGNVSASGLIKKLVRSVDGRRDVVGLTDHLLHGFEICRENRNIVLHSRLVVNYLSQRSSLSKRVKTGGTNTFDADLPSLVQVATETDAFAWFAQQVFWLVLTHPTSTASPMAKELLTAEPSALPDKPQLPRKLNPTPPPGGHKGGSRQP